MEQVSGRAGRRTKTGKVVIQTSDPGNKIIRLVLNHDYRNMFKTQMEGKEGVQLSAFLQDDKDKRETPR